MIDTSYELFEKQNGRGFDYTKEPDAWNRPVYKHPHLRSIYDGWKMARENIGRKLNDI